MAAEEIKALVHRFFEEHNKGKAAAMTIIDKLCATNLVYHGGGGEEIRDIKNYKQSTSEGYNACPDLHYTIEDMVAEGDKVVIRVTVSGTHRGEFMGVAPTNKRVSWTSIIISRIVNGIIVERWANTDMMQQLGAVAIKTASK